MSCALRVHSTSRQTFLGAQYRRMCKRMPKMKAQGAIMRKQLVIAHALLSDPEAKYEDLGPDYHERRKDTHPPAPSHLRELERLGYNVTTQAIDPATGQLLPAIEPHTPHTPATPL